MSDNKEDDKNVIQLAKWDNIHKYLSRTLQTDKYFVGFIDENGTPVTIKSQGISFGDILVLQETLKFFELNMSTYSLLDDEDE